MIIMKNDEYIHEENGFVFVIIIITHSPTPSYPPYFQFERLSFAAGRKFAWCAGPDGLYDWLGKAHDKIICGIGKDEEWLKERLAGGTTWRVFVWNGDGTRELGDWDGLFKLIAREYGAELHKRLSKWRTDLQSKKFDDIIAKDWRRSLADILPRRALLLFLSLLCISSVVLAANAHLSPLASLT